MWLAAFSFMLGFLLTLLGWKYQNSSVSLFHTHGAIMLLLIIDVCTFTIALAMTILPTANRTHLSLFKNVCLISGAFACNLLLLILVPLFGWFIFTIFLFVLVWLLYGLYNQILQCCKKILEPMWHSISEAFHSLCDRFRDIFQSIWQTPSQAFSESSPNMCRIKKCDWKIMSN